MVEALRTEYIAHALLEYPVAELLSVGRSRDGWPLRLDGEYRGAPLIAEVSTKEPPETWQSDLGEKYVLTRTNGERAIYSRFYDLRAGDAPATPEVGEDPMVGKPNAAVDRAARTREAGEPASSGDPLPPRPHRVGFAAEQPVPVDRPSSEPRQPWNLSRLRASRRTRLRLPGRCAPRLGADVPQPSPLTKLPSGRSHSSCSPCP